MDDDGKQILRLSITNLITNYQNKNNFSNKFEKYEKKYNLTKKYLTDNHELIVVDSDKAKTAITLLKCDYINEMENMLHNEVY